MPPPEPDEAPGLVRHPDAAAFLDAIGHALEPREDEHNLMLGAAIARRGAEAAGIPQFPVLLAHLGPAVRPTAALMMTPPYPLVIAHLHGAPAELADDIARTVEAVDLPIHGVLADTAMADAFAAAWLPLRSGRIRDTIAERLHRADAVEPVAIRDGRLIVARPEHFPLLVDWVTAFHAEALPDEPPTDHAYMVGLAIEQGDYFVWEEGGEPLGMAARARRTPRGICINSVYTPPEHRGKGVAQSCVATVTRSLLEEVDFCVLYTDLANATSTALYRRIGYRPVRDFTLHWFDRVEG